MDARTVRKRRRLRLEKVALLNQIFDKIMHNNLETLADIQTLIVSSDEEKLDRLNQVGMLLCMLVNPTEEMKRVAVARDPWAIMFVDDPSEELQTIAINKEPAMIRWVDNPTKSVQMLAKLLEQPKPTSL